VNEGKHLVRVFPRWFTEKFRGGESLVRQYHEAIGEWGFYLSTMAGLRGKYPGEIDRCLWNSLGKPSFMHKIPSKYKSFTFDKAEVYQSVSMPVFERILGSGNEIHVFKFEDS
jgi:hypothetical protein